jgi:DNA-directed RNA polymerase specialized sigma24 family protein
MQDLNLTPKLARAMTLRLAPSWVCRDYDLVADCASSVMVEWLTYGDRWDPNKGAHSTYFHMICKRGIWNEIRLQKRDFKRQVEHSFEEFDVGNEPTWDSEPVDPWVRDRVLYELYEMPYDYVEALVGDITLGELANREGLQTKHGGLFRLSKARNHIKEMCL